MRVSTNVLLYTSHSLSRWGDRMWSFSIGLFLIHLYPQSLLVTALFTLITKFFGVILTGTVGGYADKMPRLKAMRTALTVQNAAVAVSSCLIIVVFELNISYLCSKGLFYLFIAVICILGIISNLGSAASAIIIERDWIVILSGGDKLELSRINAAMRRIDQVCLLLAPVLSGAIVSLCSTTWAAAVIAAWNFISYFIEYYLLTMVYRRVPDLAKDKDEPYGDDVLLDKPFTYKVKYAINAFFDNFRVFIAQPVAWAGFCLSLVYLTVLGFGSITVAYLKLMGLKDVYIGVTMAVGACFGICGTFIYPYITKKFDVIKTGLVGAGCLAISICICLSSVFFEKTYYVPDSSNSNNTCSSNGSVSLMDWKESQADDDMELQLPTILILVGITTLRFGLWMYDLSISQQFQETVIEVHRNKVGGVQASFNNFFDCLYVLFTIAMPAPEDFDTLIIISVVAVLTSCFIYMCYALCGRSQPPLTALTMEDVEYRDLPGFGGNEDVEDYDLGENGDVEFEEVRITPDHSLDMKNNNHSNPALDV